MRKSVFIFLCIILNTQLVHSQRNNIISANPLFLLGIGIYDIKYERVASEAISISLNPSYMQSGYFNILSISNAISGSTQFKNLEFSRLNIALQARGYLQDKAPNKLFVGGEIGFGNLELKGSQADVTFKNESASFNTGLFIGYQYAFRSQFVIEWYLGLSKLYLYEPTTEKKLQAISNNALIQPSAGFSVGIQF